MTRMPVLLSELTAVAATRAPSPVPASGGRVCDLVPALGAQRGGDTAIDPADNPTTAPTALQRTCDLVANIVQMRLNLPTRRRAPAAG